MKQIFWLLLTTGLFFQAHADISLPGQLHGYWEGNEMSLFIFQGGMRVVEKEGAPPVNLALGNDVIVFDEVQTVDDEVRINFSQAELEKPHEIVIRILDDYHIALKFRESVWVDFERKKASMLSYCAIFDYENTLDKKLFSASLNHSGKYKKLTTMPDVLKGLWFSDMFHSLIFEDKIIDGYGLTWIDDVFKNENLYIIKGRRDVSNEPLLLIFRLDGKKMLFQSYTIYYLINNAHKKELDLLVELSHEYQDESGRVGVNDIFFDNYYLPGVSESFPDFATSFQVKKEGKVNILGIDYELTQITAMIWGEAAANTSILGFMLELENTETKEKQNVQAMLSNSKFKFIKFNDGSTQVFQSFNSLIWSFFTQSLIVIGAVLITILVFYRLIILPRKLKQRLTQSQLEGIKSQLNPHFLFNSMASIQSLLNQEKPEEANRYLSELSDLLRYHLDTGAEDMVLLSEELSTLQHYCELENLRAPFELAIEVDTSINPEITEIPNQLLQPLLENAIKHGLRYAEKPRLVIRIQKLEKHLFIHILDNGPGIVSSENILRKLPTLRKTHKGLALINEKISILKKKGLKVKLQVDDREKELGHQESGTQATLEIPLNY